MAKIKNVSGEARHVAWLGGRLVHDGQEVDVPDDTVTAYTQQILQLPDDAGELVEHVLWEPADDVARQLHDEMLEAIAYLEAVANPPAEPNEADVRAALAELLAATPAKELIDDVKDVDDVDVVAASLAMERAAAKPRSTVIAAFEKRLAELAPPPPPDGDQGTTEQNGES